MAANNLHFQPLNLQKLILLLLFSSFFIHPSVSQSTPQNIQVYFQILTPPLPPPPFTPTTSVPAQTTPSTSSGKTVAKAVGITAATSLVILGLLFLSVVMFKRHSKKETTNPYADNGINRSNNNHGLRKDDEFVVGGIKGEVVDEQGLDVFYWKRLEDYTSFKKENLKNDDNRNRKSKFDFPVQEAPFLRGNSSTSHLWPVEDYTKSQTLPVVNPLLKHARNQETIKSQPSLKCPQSPPAQSLKNAAVVDTAPLPLPPAAAKPRAQPLPNAAVAATAPLPPPLPLPPAARPPALPWSNPVVPAPTPPPPPPLRVERKRDVPPPPLPPKTSGLTSSSRQPTQKDNLSSSSDNQVKFIPLHWDKVNTNLGHSMVWHKLHNGSFRYSFLLLFYV